MQMDAGGVEITLSCISENHFVEIEPWKFDPIGGQTYKKAGRCYS